MNCIDVHRKLITEPRNQDEAVIAHLEQCPACAKFAKSNEKFDASLQQAADIEVPDGLAERILLKQSFKQQRLQRNNRFKLYAMAASLLLVFGVSFNINNFSNMLHQSLSLEEVAIKHVTDEIHHLHEKNNIKLAKLNNVLQPFDVQFKNKIGDINYAGSCKIRKSKGVHVVFQKGNNKATLLVMPGEYITQRKTHTKNDFTTTLIPTQNGSIAIVNHKNENAKFIQNLEKEIQSEIQFI